MWLQFAYCVAVAAATATAVAADTEVGPPIVAPLRIEVSSGAALPDVRDCIRTLSPADRTRAVEVVLAPGEYVLPEGLEFSPEDGGISADAPIAWRAAKPG